MPITTKKLSEIPPASEEELRRLDAIRDKDIDFSDIPELDEEWFKTAKVVLPAKKKAISLRVDLEVLEWFKSQAKGRGYQTLINAVLEAYVNAQKSNG